MIRSTLVASALFLSVGLTNAAAFDVNDCIINGMKGVSSDIAARQVRLACDQKNVSYKRQIETELSKAFGDVMDAATLEGDKYFVIEEPGFHSMQYTNTNVDKTVTYVRLEVVPAPGSPPDSPCDRSKRRVFAYKITMKPRTTIKLIYPAQASANCLRLVGVVGRAPSWKDVSFSSSAKPAETDPYEATD